MVFSAVSAASPYYSTLHFTVFVPVAILYSIVARIFLRPKLMIPPTLLDTAAAASPTNGVAIVTGSNTGIGFATARALVLRRRFATVVLACRSRAKGAAAAQQIQQEHANTNNNATNVVVLPLDLSDMGSVVEFCDTILERYGPASVGLLVNNAGCNTGGEHPTADGFEQLFCTNFLGHFVLTLRLLHTNMMAKGGGARIINLSSVMHHFSGPIAATPTFWKQVAYENSVYQYSRSKLAAILLTVELNRRYSNIRSVAVNPGAVNSDIWRGLPNLVRSLFGLIYLTNEQGSYTTVAAALLEDLLPKDDDCIYLQPYWLPQRSSTAAPPFPVFEMLGPFQGYRVTRPRLPTSSAGSTVMWDTFAALTQEWWNSGKKYDIGRNFSQE